MFKELEDKVVEILQLALSDSNNIFEFEFAIRSSEELNLVAIEMENEIKSFCLWETLESTDATLLQKVITGVRVYPSISTSFGGTEDDEVSGSVYAVFLDEAGVPFAAANGFWNGDGYHYEGKMDDSFVIREFGFEEVIPVRFNR